MLVLASCANPAPPAPLPPVEDQSQTDALIVAADIAGMAGKIVSSASDQIAVVAQLRALQTDTAADPVNPGDIVLDVEDLAAMVATALPEFAHAIDARETGTGDPQFAKLQADFAKLLADMGAS